MCNLTLSTIFKVRVLHACLEMAILTFHPSNLSWETLLKLGEWKDDLSDSYYLIKVEWNDWKIFVAVHYNHALGPP